MSDTSKQLEAARQAVADSPHIERAHFVALQSLRGLHDERAKGLRFALENQVNPRPLDMSNCVGDVFRATRNFSEFYDIKSSLDFVLSQPDMVAAESKIIPLVAKVRELEDQLREEEHAASRAKQERLEAQLQAEQAALAEVRAKFADPEPEPEAEAEPPAPPFRGKGLKMASA
jgi:hypothetical protein